MLELVLLAFPAQGQPGAQGEKEAPALSTVQVMQTQAARGISPVLGRFNGQVSALLDGGAIVVDGAALTVDQARTLVLDARPYVDDVEFIDQKQVLVSGCELVALSAIMKAENVSFDLQEVVANHLTVGSHVSTDYLGDPTKNGGGLPPSVVAAANGWLAVTGADARVTNISGTTFEGLKRLTSLGYPVAIWVTEDMKAPIKTGAVEEGMQWYRKEHCVVVYGFEGDDVLVADSLKGLVRQPVADVQKVYEACGSFAMMVLPQGTDQVSSGRISFGGLE